MKTKVLILCTGNSCRSQMAEGFLRAYGGDAYEAHSAGTAPSTVNPLAVEVMREAGVDISQQRSKNVTEYLGQHFPVIITVCDNAAKNCPIFPGPAVRLHWPFEDPALATGTPEDKIAIFRKVRNEIALRIQSWIAERKALTE
jgi:arsenate reductase